MANSPSPTMSGRASLATHPQPGCRARRSAVNEVGRVVELSDARNNRMAKAVLIGCMCGSPLVSMDSIIGAGGLAVLHWRVIEKGRLRSVNVFQRQPPRQFEKRWKPQAASASAC